MVLLDSRTRFPHRNQPVIKVFYSITHLLVPAGKEHALGIMFLPLRQQHPRVLYSVDAYGGIILKHAPAHRIYILLDLNIGHTVHWDIGVVELLFMPQSLSSRFHIHLV